MQVQFKNHEAVKLDEETASSDSLQMGIHCIEEKVAEKSTHSVKLFFKENNKLFEMYWNPGIFSPDNSGTKKDPCVPGKKVRI